MLRVLLATLTVGALLVGCRPPAYQQPTLEAPHATVKVRRNYHSRPGPQLSENIRLGEFGIDERVYGEGQADLTTVHLRVRPELNHWVVASQFFHTVTRAVQRTRQVSERYACGTNSSGMTQYCTRYRTENYTEMVTDTIVDGVCRDELEFLPRTGDTYLLQYDFYQHGQCVLRCFRQVPAAQGEFHLDPCPAPPPPPPSLDS